MKVYNWGLQCIEKEFIAILHQDELKKSVKISDDLCFLFCIHKFFFYAEMSLSVGQKCPTVWK